ncbi:kinase-like domain-containing protein [Clohesyomyces aquaticus]|uniref:Kinase-like domain-containing protein n=1 Tax=Clohesyomyces aquaticus TaxID=1231657 RepID=A0A1Y1ZUZ3_9PLEO|nr:kinase-like domain-containing protein [Clohesyomyces aquaticus]
MSARTLTNVVNDQTIAMNAMIFGYAGHSLVTPQHTMHQLWWTDDRINEKVTKEYITSRLRPNERDRLGRPVGFGGGDLTDDTYMEWILERARRLFLVLSEVGVSEKIFAVVERSWDDDDLPLQMEDIEKLSLSNKKFDQQQLSTRFFNTQFTFLLRELREGVHIDYAPNEVLPLEYVMELPPAVSLQHWSRVHPPTKPNEVYVRRKFSLGTAESPGVFESDFLMDIESARMVEHDHIARIHSSYTVKDTGYILTNFVGQHTLRTFIDHRNPTQYQKLPKPTRRYLVLGWLHCLADALTTLHQNGFCHSAVRPSNILIDEKNNIAFSDIGSLETFQKDKKPDPMEAYVYGAPEAHTSALSFDVDMPAPLPNVGGNRQPSIVSKSSSGSSNSNGSIRQKLTKSPTSEFSSFNFGFRKTKKAPKPRSRIHETEKADVFSLGCIFLEIVTFMMKLKPSDFLKHRSSKQKVNAGGKNSRTDSSFHANIDKIETWMKKIEEASFKHDDDAFRTVPPIMNLIRGMLSRAPHVRPSARDIRDRLLDILLQYTAIPEVHCGAHSHDIGIATSSNSGSDNASTISSLRSSSLSTMSSDSDADTIRHSTTTSVRVSSILNSYHDRASVLSEISEMDDDESMGAIGRPMPPPLNTLDATRRNIAPSAASPVSPRSSGTPVSPQSPRQSSPSGENRSRKTVPWNKPFMRLP